MLILTLLMLFFSFTPTIVRVVKTKKLDTKITLYTLVSGSVFAYSSFYGIQALIFVFSEEFKQYSLPQGFDGYMVLGLLAFITGTFLSYYEMGFKDLAERKHKNSSEEKTNMDMKSRKNGQNSNIEAFQRVIDQIDILLEDKGNNIALFEEVKTTAESLIIDHFEKNSNYYHDFARISFTPGIYSSSGRKKAEKQAQKKGLGKLKGILRACINYFENQ